MEYGYTESSKRIAWIPLQLQIYGMAQTIIFVKIKIRETDNGYIMSQRNRTHRCSCCLNWLELICGQFFHDGAGYQRTFEGIYDCSWPIEGYYVVLE